VKKELRMRIVRVDVETVNSRGVERRGPAGQAVNPVTLAYWRSVRYEPSCPVMPVMNAF